jgi:hypothetical protein
VSINFKNRRNSMAVPAVVVRGHRAAADVERGEQTRGWDCWKKGRTAARPPRVFISSVHEQGIQFLWDNQCAGRLSGY